MIEKLEKVVRVKNRMGLHVRPASYIVQLLEKSQSKVVFTYRGESVNARSIMSIMILAAPKDAKIQISVEGGDAKQTMDYLMQAFEIQFGEKQI